MASDENLCAVYFLGTWIRGHPAVGFARDSDGPRFQGGSAARDLSRPPTDYLGGAISPEGYAVMFTINTLVYSVLLFTGFRLCVWLRRQYE
jgi:hypothetical protein